MKKIKEILPYVFEDQLIISFSKDWVTVFKQIPEFDVFIDNEKRLHLISKQKMKNNENDL